MASGRRLERPAPIQSATRTQPQGANLPKPPIQTGPTTAQRARSANLYGSSGLGSDRTPGSAMPVIPSSTMHTSHQLYGTGDANTPFSRPLSLVPGGFQQDAPPIAPIGTSPTAGSVAPIGTQPPVGGVTPANMVDVGSSLRPKTAPPFSPLPNDIAAADAFAAGMRDASTLSGAMRAGNWESANRMNQERLLQEARDAAAARAEMTAQMRGPGGIVTDRYGGAPRMLTGIPEQNTGPQFSWVRPRTAGAGGSPSEPIPSNKFTDLGGAAGYPAGTPEQAEYERQQGLLADTEARVKASGYREPSIPSVDENGNPTLISQKDQAQQRLDSYRGYMREKRSADRAAKRERVALGIDPRTNREQFKAQQRLWRMSGGPQQQAFQNMLMAANPGLAAVAMRTNADAYQQALNRQQEAQQHAERMTIAGAEARKAEAETNAINQAMRDRNTELGQLQSQWETAQQSGDLATAQELQQKIDAEKERIRQATPDPGPPVDAGLRPNSVGAPPKDARIPGMPKYPPRPGTAGGTTAPGTAQVDVGIPVGPTTKGHSQADTASLNRPTGNTLALADKYGIPINKQTGAIDLTSVSTDTMNSKLVSAYVPPKPGMAANPEPSDSEMAALRRFYQDVPELTPPPTGNNLNSRWTHYTYSAWAEWGIAQVLRSELPDNIAIGRAKALARFAGKHQNTRDYKIKDTDYPKYGGYTYRPVPNKGQIPGYPSANDPQAPRNTRDKVWEWVKD